MWFVGIIVGNSFPILNQWLRKRERGKKANGHSPANSLFHRESCLGDLFIAKVSACQEWCHHLDAFIGEYRFIRLSTSNIAFLVFSLVYSISVISSYSELPCSPFALVRYEIGHRQLGAFLAFTISILTCSWKNWIIKTNGFVRVIPIKWMKFFYSGSSVGVHRSEVIQN